MKNRYIEQRYANKKLVNIWVAMYGRRFLQSFLHSHGYGAEKGM